MIKKIILFFALPFCFQSTCIGQNKLQSDIIELLSSNEISKHHQAIELMEYISNPQERLINSVFATLSTPPFSSYINVACNKFLKVWGVYTTPYLVEALHGTSSVMYHRAPKLLLAIAQYYEPNIISSAIPGLMDYLKKAERERHAALWALAELGVSAKSTIPYLAKKMHSSKHNDIHWSFEIAKALEKIAGYDYPPIQSILLEKKEYEKQDTTLVEKDFFKLEIGFNVSHIDFKIDKMQHSILTSPSQTRPFKIIKYAGVVYHIGLKNNRIIYISTSDSHFKTKNSLAVGDRLKKVNEFKTQELIKLNGWGYVIKLKSGWKAAFCEGSSCTDNKPSDHSTIDWFYKK